MKKSDTKNFCFEKGHSKFKAINCYDREDFHLKIKFKSLVRIRSKKKSVIGRSEKDRQTLI